LKRLIILSLFCAAAVFGQCSLSSDGTPEPNCILPGEPNPSAYTNVKTYLGLTDAQVTQLTNLYNTRQQSVRSLWEQVSQKQRALDQLLESGSQDASAAGALVIAMANLRRQIEAGDGPYRDSALAVLTADQKTKLQGLDAARKLQTTIYEAMSLGLLDGGGVYRVLEKPMPVDFTARAR